MLKQRIVFHEREWRLFQRHRCSAAIIQTSRRWGYFTSPCSSLTRPFLLSVAVQPQHLSSTPLEPVYLDFLSQYTTQMGNKGLDAETVSLYFFLFVNFTKLLIVAL